MNKPAKPVEEMTGAELMKELERLIAFYDGVDAKKTERLSRPWPLIDQSKE